MRGSVITTFSTGRMVRTLHSRRCRCVDEEYANHSGSSDRKKAFSKQRPDQSMLENSSGDIERGEDPRKDISRRGRGFLGVSLRTRAICIRRVGYGRAQSSVYGVHGRDHRLLGGFLVGFIPLVSDYGELSDAYKQEGRQKTEQQRSTC